MAVDTDAAARDVARRARRALHEQPRGARSRSGECDGTVLVAPGTEFAEIAGQGHPAARLEGKVFDRRAGRAAEPDHAASACTPIRAKVYRDASWLDQKETIVLDYSKTSLVAHWIRDEIREVAPGLYLGLVFWEHDADPVLRAEFAELSRRRAAPGRTDGRRAGPAGRGREPEAAARAMGDGVANGSVVDLRRADGVHFARVLRCSTRRPTCDGDAAAGVARLHERRRRLRSSGTWPSCRHRRRGPRPRSSATARAIPTARSDARAAARLPAPPRRAGAGALREHGRPQRRARSGWRRGCARRRGLPRPPRGALGRTSPLEVRRAVRGVRRGATRRSAGRSEPAARPEPRLPPARARCTSSACRCCCSCCCRSLLLRAPCLRRRCCACTSAATRRRTSGRRRRAVAGARRARGPLVQNPFTAARARQARPRSGG